MHTHVGTRSFDGAPATIDPDEFPSALHLLEQALAKHSDRTAIRCFGEALSYAEIDLQSALFASFLQNDLGIRKGDRIASMMPNLPAFPVSLLGIMRAGAAQVNVNPLYTARELKHQLNDAGCEVIVVHAGSTATLAEVLSETSIRHIIVVANDSCLGVKLPSPEVDSRLAGTVRFADALIAGTRKPHQHVDLRGEDLLFLQYTGGTTGLSKGAALTHRNLVAVTRQMKASLGDQLQPDGEVIVTAIPLYHVFALALNLILYLEAGAENWLVPSPRNLDDFIATLKAARPTAFSGVNTLYNSLLSHPEIGNVDWSRLHMCVGGGAAVMRNTSDRWQALTGRPIQEGYGLSETSVGVSIVPGDTPHFTGTCGRVMPGTEVRLIDDDGQEVPSGSAGEILVRGPQVMRGYWNQPEATTAAFTSDGYFRTGDIGLFDSRGFLKVVDRKKDMVLVSGFNVYPAEVETVAATCVGVAECAAVGVPDTTSGESVVLYAVLQPDARLTETELLAHCRLGLAGYKVPKVIRFIDALPKSNVGKVLRRELRGRS